MTQSYNIGGVRPVDIDPYEPTEYDPVGNINKKIDEDIQDWDRYYTERANYYQEALSPDNSPAARLTRLIKTGSETLPKIHDFVSQWNDYNSFYNHYAADDKGLHITDENGNIKGINGAYVDSDINADQKLENEQNVTRSDAYELDSRLSAQLDGLSLIHI